jgi:hypothetical protein
MASTALFKKDTQIIVSIGVEQFFAANAFSAGVVQRFKAFAARQSFRAKFSNVEFCWGIVPSPKRMLATT